MPYEAIERHTSASPNFSKVKAHAMRFGATEEEVVAWIDEAKAYLEKQAKKEVDKRQMRMAV